MASDIDETQSGGRRKSRLVPLALVGLAAVAAGWGYFSTAASERARARTENTLQLQVLTSRLGVAAFEAEYGDYDAALEIASEVFNGVQNYGIEHASLPEEYAAVLRQRDGVVRDLARSDPKAAETLMRFFFELQIPIDTELEPSRILPAADSALGLTPPVRGQTRAAMSGTPTPTVAESAGSVGGSTSSTDQQMRSPKDTLRGDSIATAPNSLSTRNDSLGRRRLARPDTVKRDTTGLKTFAR